MNIRQKQRVLWLIAGSLITASIATVAFTLLVSPEINGNGAQSRRHSPNSLDHNGQNIPPLSAFASIWNKDLRRPVYDPPPQAKAVVKRPTLQAELKGTATEDIANSCAFFSVQGQTIMASVGDKIGKSPNVAEILKIEADKVVVRYYGEKLILKLKKQK